MFELAGVVVAGGVEVGVAVTALALETGPLLVTFVSVVFRAATAALFFVFIINT